MSVDVAKRARSLSPFTADEPAFDLAADDEFIASLFQQPDAPTTSDQAQISLETHRQQPAHTHASALPPRPTPALSWEALNHFFINPQELNFLPCEDWVGFEHVPLKYTIESHFKARSTKHLHFEHKLWNALALTKRYPELINIVGIVWETSTVIRVDKTVFGALLGLTKPTAALFNPQGSFRSHGFREVLELGGNVDVEPTARYFVHESGEFTKYSPADAVTKILKWKPRDATNGSSVSL